MAFLFGGLKAPPPSPPPPNPPLIADPSTQASANAAQLAAAAAAGQGFNNTIQSSPQGAPAPSTAQKQLLGQ